MHPHTHTHTLTHTRTHSHTKATGNTDLIPWLTSYFYIYYPALIILVCIATLLSLGTRLVSLFGYQKFIGEDDFSADYIDEGKALMKRGEEIIGEPVGSELQTSANSSGVMEEGGGVREESVREEGMRELRGVREEGVREEGVRYSTVDMDRLL